MSKEKPNQKSPSAKPRQPRRRKTAKRTELRPIIPMREAVLFPYTIISLGMDSPGSIELLENAVGSDRLVALVSARDLEHEPRELDDFHPLGCEGRIVKTLRLPDESRRILIRGLRRIKLESIEKTEPFLTGRIRAVTAPADDTLETEALASTVRMLFQNIVAMSPIFPDELRVVAHNIDDPARLADMIADTLSLSFEEKMAVLAAVPVRERLEIILSFLNREEVVLRVGSEIQSKVSTELAKGQREHFLREQLKAIQEQLGEEAETPDITELREKIDSAGLPEEAAEAAYGELKRLRQMHPAAADYNVARTYIDWILALPWNKRSVDRLDISQAERILNRDHYGLERVKERILEYLAVLQLKKDMKAPILCFVGPPGVGKTSLGQSIARALGREFVRFSLGGIRDEAEIRGHRRTYVGALPGRVIQGLKRAKTANPVFMLDEIDKLGTDFRGDPASALLEVLDPQQNASFSDHYLEISFDLSSILFITTANLIDPIPPPLRDRMEIIRIPGYTQEEKSQIAKRFLAPRQLAANGLSKSQLTFSKGGLDTIINAYTSEAGVRNLEREIASVCRKHARKLVEGKAAPEQRITVSDSNIREYLGPERLFPDKAIEKPIIGVSTGLAWTSAGGEILHVEATTVPGSGKLVLTGSLGDVMKESAQIAYTYVRSRHGDIGFDPERLKSVDIHVHVPAGATPKDGPSAGIAIATALASLLSDRAVKARMAMTGEISLQGHVLPVGGIKEKVLAAARGGVHTVVLPEKNRNELEEDIPAEIRKKIRFEFATTADQVLNAALTRNNAG